MGVNVVDLKVIGSLPQKMDGFFLRVGPNSAVPDHVLDGVGMVHEVRLVPRTKQSNY